MTCLMCKSEGLSPGQTTVTLERGVTTVVIKGVPANVCETCGEPYIDEATTRAIYQLGEDAVSRGAEVEIIRFAA